MPCHRQVHRKVHGKKNHGQMEYFLNITPHTYVDNKNNIGYFRLDLKVNDNAEGLNPLPKDVYFIIDTSRSISNKQLREFKIGVHKGLYSLNKNDRFDIVFFSTKAKAFFKTFNQATSKNIQLAQGFLKKSSNYGKTDIYNSIKPYINDISRTNNRPIQLFLLTDGVSTVSKSMKDSALINKITQNNNADVSVFGFSCGPKNNSFLIDFISYRNRGDSLPQRKVQDSGQKLTSYIANYSKIIVADLKYKFMGKYKNNTFPKKLPHLYRQKSLSVFGTFDPSEKETFIQLLGESSSGPRQLIYKLNYSQATPANEDLAKHWASQKIYHLIGKLIDTPSQIISNEIQELKKKFKVYIPYNLPEVE
ncbi:MAG: VWA domain-containing protein [Lentisphaeraceae bacterium]|nr:VWA domain-containing protein [Lentisphaeraceae bacterium]